MKLKKKAKYDIVAVSSMGARITPMDRQPVHTSTLFRMQATSAETNVLNISSSLGKNALVLTKFVSGNSVAQFIKGELRKRNIEYVGSEVPSGGPWGYRHQLNIADSGYGLRGPVVTNDRAGEVGRTIKAKDFDLEQIFKKDGCRILHISGLIAALSEDTTKACVDIAKYAKSCGTAISFDLNYRASFWEGRESKLRKDFKTIAGLADILVGNEEDFQLALGIKGPEAGGTDLGSKIDSFKNMIGKVRKAYPNAEVFATTLREVLSANEHLWGALLWEDGKWAVEEARPIQVFDRIGGGDGFVGGLLYGVLQGFDIEKQLQFAWASGVLAATVAEDYATPSGEDQIMNIYKGNARVKR
ncbi:MAG: sugar kinase [Firmicutes bacterium]|nr:sugar kinase [Bacillota bacterium]